MKKHLLLLIFITNILFGADKIFNDYNEYGKTNFMSGDVKFSELGGTSVMFIGTNVGVTFDNRFYAGGAIFTSIPDYFANGQIVESDINLTYVGGVFGILLNGDDSYHTVFNILGGFGIANDVNYVDSDFVLILEPEIAIEFNLTNFARLKIGASWRITQGVDENHLSNGFLISDSTLFGAGYGDIFSINMGVILGQY